MRWYILPFVRFMFQIANQSLRHCGGLTLSLEADTAASIFAEYGCHIGILLTPKTKLPLKRCFKDAY